MIGWIRGRLVLRDPAAGVVVVDAQGVGWELNVSIQTLAKVPEEGQEAELWVHTNVREDAIQLFGFASPREKQLFRMLTSVPKVGPRNALAVLGGFPALELAECISAKESAKLVKIPGIGKKTAEQIVLTLSDKLATLLEQMRIEVGGAARTLDAAGEALEQHGSESQGPAAELGADVRDVLLSLGWKAKPVERALAVVLDELGAQDDQGAGLSLDALVRATLAQLMER